MVSIYLLNISLNWSTCEKRLIRCVSKKRQERIRKNNVAINKKALLIGALLTRSLVKAKLNIKNNDQRYSNELNHKPYLKITRPNNSLKINWEPDPNVKPVVIQKYCWQLN